MGGFGHALADLHLLLPAYLLTTVRWCCVCVCVSVLPTLPAAAPPGTLLLRVRALKALIQQQCGMLVAPKLQPAQSLLDKYAAIVCAHSDRG